jgi:heme-degrading monooxygenase HmoA
VSIIKINAITVPEDSGDELAHRFAARAGAVDDQEGFEGFELLKPTDDRTTWLVVTLWHDGNRSGLADSPAFSHGHRSSRPDRRATGTRSGRGEGGREAAGGRAQRAVVLRRGPGIGGQRRLTLHDGSGLPTG